MMKSVIVLFGGSFNPPTHSHFSLAEQVYCSFKQIEKIIFMPVADSYPKKDLLDAMYRVEMLEKVCEKNAHFEVSTFEVDAPSLMNSIDTLNALQKKYRSHEIWLTIGSDNLKLMPSWPCYLEILDKYKCLVLERDKDKIQKIISSHSVLSEHRERFVETHELVHSDCNATLIRKLLREGKSIRYLVPDEVYHYITEKGLYTIIDTK